MHDVKSVVIVPGSIPSIYRQVILPIMDEYSKFWGPACLGFAAACFGLATAVYVSGGVFWRAIFPALFVGGAFMVFAGVAAWRGYKWAKKSDEEKNLLT